jgi:hypothetical protein
MQKSDMELPNTPENPVPLVLREAGVESLAGAAKWSRIFAIIGIVFLCLYVPLMFCLSLIMVVMIIPPVVILGFYLLPIFIVLLPLAIAPAIFLFRHSKNARLAAENCDGERFEHASRNMKSLSKYAGILLIIYILYTVAYWGILIGLILSNS